MPNPNDDEILPDLPPLVDDGSVGVEDGALDESPNLEDSVGLDDSVFVDASEDFAIADEEASWIGDDESGVDIDEEELATEPEEGWLDEQPLADLDLGTLGENDAQQVVGTDAGQEGVDEPIAPRGRDADEIDLPPLDRSEDDSSELDVGIATPSEP